MCHCEENNVSVNLTVSQMPSTHVASQALF